MEKNNSMLFGIIAAVIVIAGAGIFFIAGSDDDEPENTTPSTSQTTEQESAPAPAPQEETAPSETVVDLAVATPTLSTLVTAVTEAELVDTLSGEGPFTVLAPTDEAFGNALEALDITAAELLARDDLGAILTYHVIAGDVMSTDLSDGMMVETVQGGTLEVDITDDGVFFVDANGGRAQVTAADVDASNGVVHVIDAVLLP